MSSSRSLGLLLVWICAFGSPAFAQARIAFDPARDLAGFESARSSEYKDLYPIDAYSDLLGKQMDKAELEKTQAQWKSESAAIQQHLADVEKNPRDGLRWLLMQRLARHPFFSKVSLTVDDSAPPFLIFVQKPAFDDPKYAPAVVQMFQPFLVKIAAVFDARVAKAAGVSRRADEPWTPIAILASTGDMQNYERVTNSGPTRSGTHYDDDLGLVVGFVNSFDKPKATVEALTPILRETFMTLMDAHATPPADGIDSAWLLQGLTGALAYPRGASLDALDKPEPRGTDLRRMVDLCHDANSRNGLLLPIAQISAAKDWEDLVKIAFADKPQPQARYPALWSAFQAESTLWIDFLLLPENGKHRAGFNHYLELAFKGAAGTDALILSFPGLKLEDLDREFWSWVYDQHKRTFPEIAIDRNDLKDLFAKPVEAVDEIVSRARASVTTPAPPEPPFVPATLAVSDKDVDSRHGMALQLARAGDYEGARTMLTALAATKPAVPDDGRIARDLERVEAAIRMRDACLSAMAQKSQRLSVEHDGKKYMLAVTKVEGGQVVFADNKQGVKSLPVTSIDPAELARIADKKEMQGDAPAWTRPWLLLLAGDARWDKVLKVDSDASRDLREDGNVWYRERLDAGLAARTMDALSKSALPTKRAEAEPIVSMLTDLMAKHAGATCVLLKKAGLQRMARTALGVMSAEVSPQEMLHGKYVAASDGTVTLAYDFQDAAQAQDFVLDKGYLGRWRQQYKPLKIAEDASTLQVSGGNLHVLGGAVWRMALGFSAPLEVQVDYIYTEQQGEMHPTPTFSVIVCDDRKESYAMVHAHGDIQVIDSQQGQSASADSTVKEFFFDRDYKLDVTHDGKKITAILDGNEVSSAQAGPRKTGDVALFVQTETDIVIHRVVVTGKPDPESLATLRRVWAARKQAEMGL